MSEPTRPTVFCKDCKFMRKQFLLPLSSTLCFHPSAVKLDVTYLVDAHGTTFKYCTTMRYASEPCGPDAKLWEPRR